MSYKGITKNQFKAVISPQEIVVYNGNCWATTLSMLFRCHGFDFSQKMIHDLFEEWRFSGVTSVQMSRLITYFNRTYLDAKNWEMKSMECYTSLLSQIDALAPLEVFLSGHFVLLLGYDETTQEVTYFDPWKGGFITSALNVFEQLDGADTAYLLKKV